MSEYPPPSSASPHYSSPSSPAGSSTAAEVAPVIIRRRHQVPTIGSLLKSAAINLFLPFVNGLMLGFGELFAHEIAWRWGWGGTRVRLFFFFFPLGRRWGEVGVQEFELGANGNCLGRVGFSERED